MKLNALNASSPQCHVLVEQVGGRPPAGTPNEIRVFARCRNEALGLPGFLEHYRALGVDRFFIIDNDSTDGTADYLAGQPDVRVFRTTDRFSEAQGGTAWLNALLREFGVGAWCVTVDIDELLLYPGSEHAALHTLTHYLDRNGYEALFCLLLDLYPSVPLRGCMYKAGDDLLRPLLHFDPRPYQMTPIDACPASLIRGGVRERVFYPEYKRRRVIARIHDAAVDRLTRVPLFRRLGWLEGRRRPTPPCLTKVPLVRWNEGSRYVDSNHWVSPKAVAPETGVLLHFKFLNDFHARVVEEAVRGEYFNGASEYRRYAETLAANPQLTLMYDESVRFEGSEQLVRIGLMHDTSAWGAARERHHLTRDREDHGVREG